MKPDEALHLLENYGGLGVPRLYAEMPRGMLQRLVDECARISGAERSEAALTAWAQQRMKQPNWQGIADKKLGIAPSKPDGEAEAAPALVESLPEEPLPEEPGLLSHRAILRPERLSTPRRRQAAFLASSRRPPAPASTAAPCSAGGRSIPSSTGSAAISSRHGAGRPSRASCSPPTMSRSGRCSIAARRSASTPNATAGSLSIS
jgi:hypothetical protein